MNAPATLPGLVRCTNCGALRIYPKPLCPRCHAEGTTAGETSGEGTLYSFSIVHRAPGPAFKPEVPYIIALIDLDEGVRVPGRLRAPQGREPRCGERVRLVPAERPYAEFSCMEP